MSTQVSRKRRISALTEPTFHNATQGFNLSCFGECVASDDGQQMAEMGLRQQ